MNILELRNADSVKGYGYYSPPFPSTMILVKCVCTHIVHIFKCFNGTIII